MWRLLRAVGGRDQSNRLIVPRRGYAPQHGGGLVPETPARVQSEPFGNGRPNRIVETTQTETPARRAGVQQPSREYSWEAFFLRGVRRKCC
jgi:hypothetical protein